MFAGFIRKRLRRDFISNSHRIIGQLFTQNNKLPHRFIIIKCHKDFIKNLRTLGATWNNCPQKLRENSVFLYILTIVSVHVSTIASTQDSTIVSVIASATATVIVRVIVSTTASTIACTTDLHSSSTN
jgi:hypothetical protein